MPSLDEQQRPTFSWKMHRRLKADFPALLTGLLLSCIAGAAFAGDCPVINDSASLDQTDGCSSLGADVASVAYSTNGGDFKEACDNHDICYRQIGYSAGECETRFLADLRASCVAAHPYGIAPAVVETIARCGISPNLNLRSWRPIRAIRNFTKRAKKEISRIDDNLKRVGAEIGRIDDSAKRFRDALVDRTTDVLGAAADLIETVPGGEAIFSVIARPDEALICMIEGTSEIAGVFDDSDLLTNGVRGALTPLGYASCTIDAEAMHRGPQAQAVLDRAHGNATIFEKRQRVVWDYVVKAVQTDESCYPDVRRYLRPVHFKADVQNTIRQVYKYAGRGEPSRARLAAHVRASNAPDWQIALIQTLTAGLTPAPIGGTDPYAGTVDEEQLRALYDKLRVYHSYENDLLNAAADLRISRLVAIIY